MEETVKQLLATGKGILAADESFPSIEKKFAKIGLLSTTDTRQKYREMLFSADGLEKYISGVILFDETIKQSTTAGVPFPKLLSDKGIIPGIKVDLGTKDIAFFEGEKVTEGLDNLRERFKNYFNLGARFSKWRAVFIIGENMPSDYCFKSNLAAMARFAALSQEAGIVPIVEPEVISDGVHTKEQCREVTKKTLTLLFEFLKEAKVDLRNVILKANMIVPGRESESLSTPQEVGADTIDVLRACVPPEIPGIVFLSGGQTEEEATNNLAEICKFNDVPWKLTFSFGRALQDSALATWNGKVELIKQAQDKLLERAQFNAQAVGGKVSNG